MQTGAIGSVLGAPTPIQLTVPALTDAANPTLALLSAPAPTLTPAVVPAKIVAAEAAVPAAAVATTVKPAARPALVHVKTSGFTPEASSETGDEAGRVLFDMSVARADEHAAPSSGVWSKVRGFLPFGEMAPAWPGKAGDVVRIGRVKTTLGSVAGQGGTSTVWQSRDRNFAVKLLHPEAMGAAGVRDEAAVLRGLADLKVPVAKLLAVSRDGRALVKEFIEGKTARETLEAGGFSRSQAEGWPELAAKLIEAGVTADLTRGNLVWQHWRSRWVIIDGAGIAAGTPLAALSQLMSPALMARAGLDPAEFLSGLRARLGPDSAKWAATLAALRASPGLAPAAAALSRRDAAAPAAPALEFKSAPKSLLAGFDDTIVSESEVARRLGYNPLLAKSKVKLHGDDPGKLNTVILSVTQPGKTPVVVKIAQWDIIRNEVALRRLARRFFGSYVRVPASLAVERGHESYLVMEALDASPSLYEGVFNLEQRAAVALLVRTFGVGDVNQGNVLVAHDKGLPWLIDFEQAFGRSAPIAGRLPDERIAFEMPWMSRRSHNRVEDYQPAVRAWRALLEKPETRAAILSDLAASGFRPADAAALLARFDLNADDLDWTLQNDADFVNLFADRNAGQR